MASFGVALPLWEPSVSCCPLPVCTIVERQLWKACHSLSQDKLWKPFQLHLHDPGRIGIIIITITTICNAIIFWAFFVSLFVFIGRKLVIFLLVSPEPEEQLAMETALYRHSKTSLDGIKSKPLKKSKQSKAKITNQGQDCAIITRFCPTLNPVCVIRLC